ncbi:MAG: hypothetical protein QXE92_02555 [Thermofilaceae archaeon]
MRKGVYVVVDIDTWSEFCMFVAKKHGKLRGVIGEELGKAIKQYMQSQQSAEKSIEEPSSQQ